MKHKRKIALIVSILTLLCFIITGCNNSIQGQNGKREIIEGFSVHYLDVGNGDCIFIKLGDGKTVLIDSAEPDDKKANYISNFLKSYGVEKIHYFIITHPDSDHIGNAPKLISEFTVEKLYLPDLNECVYEYFPILQRVKELAQEKNIEIKTNDNYKVIIGDGYGLVFLTPYPNSFSDSSYKGVNGELIPDQSNVNDISPIIYLESNGVRFIFTGDAGNSQEKLVLKVLDDPIFKARAQKLGISVNLHSIDFLKLGHHGSNSSSCLEFLQTLEPKNAVISVGGDNYYGQPNTEVLKRLSTVNPDYKLFRTDVHGTISVGVLDGEVKIIIDKSN